MKIENYNRKNRFLTVKEVEENITDILKFFPFKNENDFDCLDYYNKKETSKNYCGLEYMKENNSYDLFSWDATKEEKKLILEFQKWCKAKLKFVLIVNNF
jgi:hypothetical protein